MGLDSYLFKRTTNDKLKMVAELKGEDVERVEMMYWRKFYDLTTTLGLILGKEIDNVTNYVLSKEVLIRLRDWFECNMDNDYYKYFNLQDDLEKLNKIIEDTLFDKYEIFFYAWW